MLQRNALVTVNVAGVNYGTWISKSGGQKEADSQKIRLGGMSNEQELGGPASRENVTVARLFDPYMQGKYHQLDAGAGLSDMSVSYTPLGNDKQPTGPAITYSGILLRCTAPEADDNSNDPGMIELEMGAHESVG